MSITKNYTAGDKVWVLDRGAPPCCEVRDVATTDGTPYDASQHGDDCYLLLKPKNHSHSWWLAGDVFDTESAVYRHLAENYRRQAAQLLKFAEDIDRTHGIA